MTSPVSQNSKVGPEPVPGGVAEKASPLVRAETMPDVVTFLRAVSTFRTVATFRFHPSYKIDPRTYGLAAARARKFIEGAGRGFLRPDQKWIPSWLGISQSSEDLEEASITPNWQSHLQQNRAGILASASYVTHAGLGSPLVAERPVAMLLGAGQAHDIPLAELAERFRVILVDLDEAGMKAALDKLDPALRSHVSCQVRDVTGGVVVDLVQKAALILNESRSPREALQKFYELLGSLDDRAHDLTAGESVHLLVSSCIISQFICFFKDQFFRFLSARFKRDFSYIKQELDSVYEQANVTMLRGHARGLAHFMQDQNGTVYFSSDLTIDRPNLSPLQRSSLFFKGLETLEPFFLNQKVIKRSSWIWALKDGPAGMADERLVEALILEPEHRPVVLLKDKEGTPAEVISPPALPAIEEDDPLRSFMDPQHFPPVPRVNSRAFVSNFPVENPQSLVPGFEPARSALFPPLFVKLADAEGNATVVVLERRDPANLNQAREEGWWLEDMNTYRTTMVSFHDILLARDLSGKVLGYQILALNGAPHTSASLSFVRWFRSEQAGDLKGVNMALTAYALKGYWPNWETLKETDVTGNNITLGLLKSFREQWFDGRRSPMAGSGFGDEYGCSMDYIPKCEAEFILSLFQFTPVPETRKRIKSAEVQFNFSSSSLSNAMPAAWVTLLDASGKPTRVLLEQRSVFEALALLIEQDYPDPFLSHVKDANDMILLARRQDGTVVGYAAISMNRLYDRSFTYYFDRVHSLHFADPSRGVKGMMDHFLVFFLNRTRLAWDSNGGSYKMVLSRILPELLQAARVRHFGTKKAAGLPASITQDEARAWCDQIHLNLVRPESFRESGFVLPGIQDPEAHTLSQRFTELSDLAYGQDKDQADGVFSAAANLWHSFPSWINPLHEDFEPSAVDFHSAWRAVHERIVTILCGACRLNVGRNTDRLILRQACENLVRLKGLETSSLGRFVLEGLAATRNLQHARKAREVPPPIPEISHQTQSMPVGVAGLKVSRASESRGLQNHVAGKSPLYFARRFSHPNFHTYVTARGQQIPSLSSLPRSSFSG